MIKLNEHSSLMISNLFQSRLVQQYFKLLPPLAENENVGKGLPHD